jgi:hypothetical protein
MRLDNHPLLHSLARAICYLFIFIALGVASYCLTDWHLQRRSMPGSWLPPSTPHSQTNLDTAQIARRVWQRPREDKEAARAAPPV